ncbi:hypothetical protein D9611_005768 [Ephemerocybe angulata]|uniref:Uncharacterized protein n=1 Tax=Ephemerocybe angulata TaxID=980116 RepID=A0A8H5BHS5_9AGAR|nr:hypothetical protein D9611_005768 [Tulosesus angulatus]
MGPPPITIYLTTIASQPALRQRQEYILRILQAKRIPFNSYDLASDEDAKKLWRRKAPADKQQLPGILVGGRFVGTFQDFEEAVEYGELDRFFKRDEEWDEAFERAPLEVKPIGVPGASLPMQMTPDHIRTKILSAQQVSPLKGKVPKPINKEPEGSRIDIGEELNGFGLQGVKVTEDELRDMISQLGLGADDAEDLVQGLSGTDNTAKDSSSRKASPLVPKKKDAPAVVKDQEPVKNEGPAQTVESVKETSVTKEAKEEVAVPTDSVSKETEASEAGRVINEASTPTESA